MRNVRYKANDGIADSSNTGTVRITVTAVNDAPRVKIISPRHASVYIRPVSLVITATALDVDGQVTRVEFYVGTTKIGTSTTAVGPNTYECPWINIPAGFYTLKVKAWDNSGAMGVSPSVWVTVNATSDTIKPSVPGNFRAVAVSYSQIDLSWDASTDNVGVLRYFIYRNGKLVQINWWSRTFSDKNLLASTKYTYQIKAQDTSYNSSTLSNPIEATTKASTLSAGVLQVSASKFFQIVRLDDNGNPLPISGVRSVNRRQIVDEGDDQEETEEK